MSDPKRWPAWRYGPNGARRIFHEGEQIPKGWQDHPDKVKAEKPAKPEPGFKEPTPEARAETIAELRAAGAVISDDASVEEINAAIDKLTEGK